MNRIAIEARLALLVGTALVTLLALSGVAWAAVGPLAVTKTVPNAGATGVARTANVQIYFNNDIRASTVTSSTFKIRKQGTTTWLGATRSVNNTISPTSTNGGSQSVATLNPSADLASGTTYQVVIVGGSSGVKDVNGGALGANKSWTFTTAVAMPPETTIGTGPEGIVASDSPAFTFSSSKAGSTFQCSLDGTAFAGCTSPKSYSGLGQGSHTFSVRAIDSAGTIDATPATRGWTVDTVGPSASITDGPPDPSASRSATFSFSGAEDGGGYRCKIDGGGTTGVFSACTSGQTFTVDADGTYTFSVRASDALGNFGQPDSFTWTVDTVAPAAPSVSLDDGSDSGAKNDNVTNDVTPTIGGTAEFASTVNIYDAQNEVVDSVQAGNSWSYTFDALRPDGSYSYTVKTTDPAGNESQGTPISLTIDTAAPDTTIGDKPASPANSASATFTFSSSESGSTFGCSLDGASFASCTSPKNYSGLADGSHTFKVAATDAAGNVDPTPASHTWTVEATAPTVTFTPGDTTDVAPNTNVRATFSEAMDEASVETSGTLTLKAEGSSTPVEATVTYSSFTDSATLDPNTDLALNTTYTATLTTGAKDLAGNALAQVRTWTFKTANAPRDVTVAPTTLDFGTISGTGGFLGTCPHKTLELTVTNNSSYDVRFGGVSITGTPSGRHFTTGMEALTEKYGWATLPAGFHVFDPVTIFASDQQTYSATLTYLDDTGAPIGNPITLKAKSDCLVVG